MKKTDIEHVDERNHNFFMVDNEIIDDYKLSVDADSLYMLIVRRAQHKKTCYPSIRRWMKEKHRGHDKANNAVKELTEKGLIKIDGRKYTNGPFVYRILPVKKGVSTSGTPFSLNGKGVSKAKKGVATAKARGVPTSGTEEYKVNKTINKTKKAGPKKPALVHKLAEEWSEYAKIKVEDLIGKDWGALRKHLNKGADIDQLIGLSKVCPWKEKVLDLTYLYSIRASLLPKIKPQNGKLFWTIDELIAKEKEEEAKNEH